MHTGHSFISSLWHQGVQSHYSWSWHKAEAQNTPPVTRRGCKVPFSWQKPRFSHGCWKVLFLQGLLLCICLMGESSQVWGDRDLLRGQ